MYTKDKNRIVKYRISENDYLLLQQISYQYNISVSQLVRNIISDYLSKGEDYANIKTD